MTPGLKGLMDRERRKSTNSRNLLRVCKIEIRRNVLEMDRPVSFKLQTPFLVHFTAKLRCGWGPKNAS